MILVTGATGKFGGSTARYLLQRKMPFRAAARSLQGLQRQFGDAAELVSFDNLLTNKCTTLFADFVKEYRHEFLGAQ